MVGKDLCVWTAPNFGQKIGLNLSEYLFFGFHLILGETIFILIFVILKISKVPAPPLLPSPFKILRTLLDMNVL